MERQRASRSANQRLLEEGREQLRHHCDPSRRGSPARHTRRSVERKDSLKTRLIGISVAGAATLALTGCGSGDSKPYDIAPIFPLTSDKCAKYNGDAEGTGFTSHCWVSKDDCERAVEDWRQAMQESAVTDAILFRCE